MEIRHHQAVVKVIVPEYLQISHDGFMLELAKGVTNKNAISWDLRHHGKLIAGDVMYIEEGDTMLGLRDSKQAVDEMIAAWIAEVPGRTHFDFPRGMVAAIKSIREFSRIPVAPRVVQTF